MDVFKLSRDWFNFCFENPEKINPTHTALYFFAIEHCNRLGWKDKFGFPSQMAMEALGIKNWRTYIKVLNDLIDFGFIKLIEKSKNQYSSNIIAIVKNTKAITEANTKALDKALQKHSQKQCKSIASIDLQETILQETRNNNLVEKEFSTPTKTLEDKKTILRKRAVEFKAEVMEFKKEYPEDMLIDFFKYWIEPNKSYTKMKFERQETWSLSLRLARWAKNQNSFKKTEQKPNVCQSISKDPTMKRISSNKNEPDLLKIILQKKEEIENN